MIDVVEVVELLSCMQYLISLVRWMVILLRSMLLLTILTTVLPLDWLLLRILFNAVLTEGIPIIRLLRNKIFIVLKTRKRLLAMLTNILLLAMLVNMLSFKGHLIYRYMFVGVWVFINWGMIVTICQILWN